MLTESNFKKKFFSITIILVIISFNDVKAREPDRFCFGISYFNAMRKQNALEGRIEIKSSKSIMIAKPLAGITFTSAGAFFCMAGFYTDFFLIKDIVFTPSFATGYFNKGNGYDLAYVIEFRTQLEISFALSGNSRVGIGFYHISNGNLGKSNPGAESVTFLYSFPIN